MTAPISRIVVWRSTSSVPPLASTPSDEHDRERVRDGPDEERELPQAVALDQVGVALDDAREGDRL